MYFMEINWTNIENKIEQMLKDKIKEEGLVKTGRLLNSIKVIADGNGSFKIQAEDYFKYLDDEHNLSSSVFGSSELKNFIEKEMADQIEKQLADEIRKKTKS